MSLLDLKFKPGHYLAFELSPMTRAELISLYPPKFARVYCHHVTFVFDLKPATLEDKLLQELYSNPVLKLVGHAVDEEGVECLAVSVSDVLLRPDGSHYHVTHSLAQGRKPFESNKLLQSKKGFTAVQAHKQLVLKGSVSLLAK